MWRKTGLWIILALGVSYSADAKDQLQWVEINSTDGLFKIDVPGDFIVDRQPEIIRVFSQSEYFTFFMAIGPRLNAREDVKRAKGKDLAKIERINLNSDRIAIKTISEGKKEMFSADIHAGTSDIIFSLRIRARNIEQPEVRRFLDSLYFDGVQFSSGRQVEKSPVVRKIRWGSLTSSQIVVDAYAIPDSDSSESPVTFGRLKPPEFSKFDTSQSRRVIILSRPEIVNSYSNLGSIRHVGTVRADVEFRKDGTIGAFKIDRGGFHRNLSNDAAESIRKTKFLPAEIGGVPTTTWRIVEFKFQPYVWF